MPNLQTCFHSLEQYITWQSEPWEVVAAVEAHRQFWKPKRVRVLLLAESHVYTRLEELGAKVLASHPGFSGAPDSFVKLVYCLGYGENQLLSTTIKGNAGTWQYWQIFQSCISPKPNFTALQKQGTTLLQRVSSKIELLQTLKNKGIWLIDASPIALYNLPNHKKPNGKQYQNILKQSWTDYIAPIIDEEKPNQVICIGKGVWDVVDKELFQKMNGQATCLPQPQGIRDRQLLRDTHAQYYALCSQTLDSSTSLSYL